MKTTSRIALPILLLCLATAGCGREPKTGLVAGEHEPLTVFLVRHAEKMDASDDPHLSVAGHARAAALRELLRDAGLEHVHSTDYLRTRDTAAPTAEAHGLQVQYYDPQDLPAFAAHLRETRGRHLVVGHSNTTPALVELLGGRPGPEIDEDAEYDRLYVVTIGKDGAATSILLRYGVPYKP
jgi:broad specificity phosphatase PhoE